MKHELYYSLVAVSKSLQAHLQELDDELAKLDPNTSIEARMVLAKLQGMKQFIDKEIKNNG